MEGMGVRSEQGLQNQAFSYDSLMLLTLFYFSNPKNVTSAFSETDGLKKGLKV